MALEEVVSQFVSMAQGYPRGSICLCPDCWRPVFALERGIGLGDKGGRAASAFRPLTVADVRALVDRADLDATWRALLRDWASSPAIEPVLQAARPKAGDPAVCPSCGGTWVKVIERERGSARDRAYELQLLHVPPLGGCEWLGRPRWADLSGAADALVVEKRSVT